MSYDKQTIATAVAVALGVAGALGWVKPTDNTAAIKTYDRTKTAIKVLEAKHDSELDDLHERQHDFENWVAKRLAEIDRDKLPEKESTGNYEPPPKHKPRPAMAPAAGLLPDADEFID